MLLHALPTENKSDTKVKCEIQQNRNEHEPHFSDHDIDNSACEVKIEVDEVYDP